MEREAKPGLGLALIVALLFSIVLSIVLYLAPGALPSALGGRPTSEEVVQAFQAEGLEVGLVAQIGGMTRAKPPAERTKEED